MQFVATRARSIDRMEEMIARNYERLQTIVKDNPRTAEIIEQLGNLAVQTSHLDTLAEMMVDWTSGKASSHNKQVRGLVCRSVNVGI